ncbi:hypothetical protein AVEN_45419-1 [Araneus ventricosus]|uniref:Tc1-like transposase DDE domain-containing protein n=1 Tax=Araneus ventricosus TaxID=182803 RepID=A0A4Y2U2E8_ARAVE|nr:hypothetical protein AVEN_45419-1 [Araneus ventricosus]
MVYKDISFWESVIFVDESDFNIFGSNGRLTLWRKPNEELNPKNLLPTVKLGGGDIMVWGCSAAAGIKTPAYSQDLNPIENLWHELKKRTWKHDISSKEQLKAVLREEWNKIDHSYT